MDIFGALLDLMKTGGPVMVPLAAVSVWMWALIVLKAEWILRVRRDTLSVTDALRRLEEEARGEEAGSCPRIAALNLFMAHYFQGKAALSGRADQLLLEAAVQRQVQGLYRYLPSIMVLAAAAPLLGLLGTVNGMVETFRVIGIYGMGNAQAMASGIKEALLTTQAGLLVAIPGVLAGQAMRKEVRRIHQRVLVFQQAVSRWLEKEWQKCSV